MAAVLPSGTQGPDGAARGASGPTAGWNPMGGASPAQPPSAYGGAMQEWWPLGLVEFGGCANLDCPSNTTWAFQGNWTNLTNYSAAPPARSLFGSASEDGIGMVIFGGLGANGVLLNDTWSLNLNGSWTELCSRCAPPARYGAAMAWDQGLGMYGDAVLFGGCTAVNATGACSQVSNDSWTWNATAGWARLPSAVSPPARMGAFMVEDSYTGVLLFGGRNLTPGAEDFNDTWGTTNSSGFVHGWFDYSSSAWGLTPWLTPPARSWAFGSYQEGTGCALMFGGLNRSTSTGYNDSWVFCQPIGWSPYAPAPANLTPRWEGAAPGNWSPVLFGGVNASGTGAVPSPTMWGWGVAPAGGFTFSPSKGSSGAPVNFSASPCPPPDSAPACSAAYRWDFGDGSTGFGPQSSHIYPAPGNYTVVLTVEGAGAIDNRSSVLLTVAQGLSLAIRAGPSATDVGLLAHFSANATGAPGPYQFNWSFGDGATATGAVASHAYLVPGTFTVIVTVTDAANETRTVHQVVAVQPDPRITGFSTSAPVLDVGQSVLLTTVASGGIAPLAYEYGGLPPGCTTSDQASQVCLPTAARSPGPVVVIVTDGLGVVASANVTLSVDPRLVVASLSATPAAIDLGMHLAATAVVAGGTGAVTYAFGGAGFPCTGTGSSSAACTPSSTGETTLSVSVTDAVGARAWANATVDVFARPSILGPTFDPSTIQVGTRSVLAVNHTGGTGPMTYVYSGLPGGCVANGGPDLNCTPTASGTYAVAVQVTDSVHQSANATLTLNVFGGGTPTGCPCGPITSWALVEIAGAVAVVAAVSTALVLLSVRRGRSRRPPGTG